MELDALRPSEFSLSNYYAADTVSIDRSMQSPFRTDAASPESPKPSGSDASNDQLRRTALIAMSIAIVVIAGLLGFRLLNYGYFGTTLYDDAYFFVRYAGNFLDTGLFEWNRGEGPVYGNTSQFYQFLVTLLHWLVDRNVVLTLSLAATLGALAYVAIVPFAYMQMRLRLAADIRWPIATCIVFLAAFDGLILPFVSGGMETTWGMALVALALFCSFRIESGVITTPAILANGVAILLVFMVRPEATLIALLAPVGLGLGAKDAAIQRAAAMVCVAGMALIGAFVLACWIYYGSALPLASLTKMSSFTTLPNEDRLFLGDPLELLARMLLFHKAEAILILCGLPMFSRWTPALLGAAVGMILLVLYHLLFVLPITGNYGRFYAPALPVLLLMSAPAIERVWEGLQTARPSRAISFALVAALAFLVVHRPISVVWFVVSDYVDYIDTASTIKTGAQASALVAERMTFFEGRLPALIHASKANCSLSSTEDGMLSALAARNRIVDISGLHDTRMAREGFSAERILVEQRPDILVQPAGWYVSWIEALERHPAFDRDYIREPPLLDDGPWIAFRRDSACALDVRKALNRK